MRKKVEQPKQGDTRTKKGFLFFPKTLGNEKRWLEFASWVQVRGLVLGHFAGTEEAWVDDHWVKS